MSFTRAQKIAKLLSKQEESWDSEIGLIRTVTDGAIFGGKRLQAGEAVGRVSQQRLTVTRRARFPRLLGKDQFWEGGTLRTTSGLPSRFTGFRIVYNLDSQGAVLSYYLRNNTYCSKAMEFNVEISASTVCNEKRRKNKYKMHHH